MSNWQDEIPRPQFSQFKQLTVNSGWYTAYDIGFDVIAICEPYQFQEVISYLVKGQDRALLIDTGLGVCPIKPVIEQLWFKELLVTNTHKHFDHIGNDAEFDKVYVYNHPSMLNIMANGYSPLHYRQVLADDTFATISPIKHVDYQFKPISCQPVETGFTFDLGQRRIRLQPAPGHSDDSVVFADDGNKLLFTGDTWYPAVLYSFEGCPLDVYQNTLAELGRQYAGYTLICSHNEPYAKPAVLTETAALIEKIISYTITGIPQDQGVLYQSGSLRFWLK